MIFGQLLKICGAFTKLCAEEIYGRNPTVKINTLGASKGKVNYYLSKHTYLITKFGSETNLRKQEGIKKSMWKRQAKTQTLKFVWTL